MNNETKNFLITVGVALAILWVFRPKLKKEDASDLLDVKYKAPNSVSEKDIKNKENAIIAMQAVKDAIADKVSKTELSKLNSMIYQDYGLKIMANKKTGKLRAMSKDGKVIAEED